MEFFKNKKKRYNFVDFESEDINDFGIAKYYYERCLKLEEENYRQHREICRLKQELEVRTKRMIITDLEVRDY